MNEPAETNNSPTPDPAETPTPSPSPSPSPTPDPNEVPKPLVGEEKSDEAPATEFVPLTAEDINFSDDFVVEESFRDEFLTIVNDQELSHKDRAQALTGLYEKAAKAASEASSQVFVEQQRAMQAEVKADTEVGGDNLPNTLSAVNKLVTEYGSPELIEELATTGLGNSLRLIKFLNKVSGLLNEGKPVQAGAPTNQEGSRASRLFPSMKG